ncbi:uncharacterized protein LOC135693915 [Rhopilema esculentum]|uniref:uncharacterized protein LOC135693915 n=1 Tax=Rhopilema esculentum TaxID=499914 RepID=UPI0031DA30B3
MTDICAGRDYRGRLKEVDVGAFDLVLGCDNYGGNHWNLFAAWPKSGKISYLNPLGESVPHLEKIKRNWRNFCYQRAMSWKTSMPREWFIVIPNHPKQHDSYNCGVFCMKFAEVLLRDQSWQFKMKSEDLISYRKMIGQLLLSDSDELDNGWCRICGTFAGDTQWVCKSYFVDF